MPKETQELCKRCSKHYSGECKETYITKGKCDYFRDVNKARNQATVEGMTPNTTDKPHHSSSACPRCGSHLAYPSYGDRNQCDQCGKIFSR